MLAEKVWKTLSKVDVNNRIEKKGRLSYLSWAWAWGELMNHFPASNYEFKDETYTDDGHCTVWCELTISEGEERITRSMWLPVMDNKNNALVKPDARAISDTRMRCLVKCIAMFGLGHYIYAGEDLPAIDQIDLIDVDKETELAELIGGCAQTWAKICKAYKITHLSKLHASKFNEAQERIKTYKAKLNENNS